MRKINSILLTAAILVAVSSGYAQTVDEAAVVAASERALAKVTKDLSTEAPGCAVGVSLNGKSVFEKAFGLAEMEYKIPNTPKTIFESGSVAKQFTAAAVLLLAQDGKLSLDDPLRKYVPELPDYGTPITIRHLLNHTAGLRDWGSVMALTGNGRGDRVVTQDLALDVMSHQKSLNFRPGAEYSYSNSGYNLAAVIVERVSKQTFNDFLVERLFKPLGMTNSSIRYDYRTVVPGRAQAYSKESEKGPWLLNMPFMNVYGNGGMLTTVGDWLKWNAMLDARTWNPKLVDELETQGILNDNRKVNYALGLIHGTYHGMKEIWHDGSTGGYQTYLTRFPEKKLSLAVLCNGVPPIGGQVAYAIVDEIFGPYNDKPAAATTSVQVPEDQLKKLAGTYRSERSHNPNRVAFDKGVLKMNGGELKAQTDGTYLLGTTGTRVKFELDKDGNPASTVINTSDGDSFRLIREEDWNPTATDLAAFAGDWYSDEAGAMFTIAVEGDKVFFVQRPATKAPLTKLYRDHFNGQGYIFWFTRDAKGNVDKLHVGVGSRLRDITFERVKK